MSHPYLKKIALIVGGIALSVVLAFVLEGVTQYRSPGVLIEVRLLPSHGEQDMTRFIVVALVLDFAVCFAVLSGVYILFAKMSSGRGK